MSKIRRFMHAVTGSVAALVIAVAIPGGHAYLAGPESLAGSGYGCKRETCFFLP